jgi:hypothetical protein
MIDQCRSVMEKYICNNPYPAEECEIRFQDEKNSIKIFSAEHLLGEVTWRKDKYMNVQEDEIYGVYKKNAKDEIKEKVLTYAVELTNYFSRLTHEYFRMGHSSKRNSRSMIGTHGEGLSAACVVLKRHKCNITATTNKYIAKIRKTFNEVSYQLIRPSNPAHGRAHKNEVKFRIVFEPPGDEFDVDSITKWILISSAVGKVDTAYGSLLIDPIDAGKQYNRSIFVSHATKGCLFGYNFADPEKVLLKGRDRNHHVQDLVLK